MDAETRRGHRGTERTQRRGGDTETQNGHRDAEGDTETQRKYYSSLLITLLEIFYVMPPLSMELNELSGIAVDIAFKLHNLYGPGLYEKVYEKLYCYELNTRKINFQHQVCIDLQHEDILFKNAFKADLILENQLLIELKSCKSFYDLHFRQLHTYLKISGLQVGLLFNFNVAKIKDGIIRVINTEENTKTRRRTQRHGAEHRDSEVN